jgi:hypothetical protein
MPEDGSDVEDVQVITDELGGERVAEAMRRQGKGELGLDLVEDVPEISFAEGVIVLGREKPGSLGMLLHQDLGIVQEDREELVAYRDVPAFAAFAVADAKIAFVEVQVGGFEIEEFFPADSRIEERLEYGEVPEAVEGLGLEN